MERVRENWIRLSRLGIFSDDVGMVFGQGKCGVLFLKSGKMVRTEGIELPDGKRMREVNLDEYKYLGVLQLDSIMKREMKEKVKSEYVRIVQKLLRSQLNGGNIIVGMDAWAVGINRYGAGVLDWTKEELTLSIDIKIRNLMTMNGSLHPRGNGGRLYLARKRGTELMNCEECVIVEVQSLGKYLSESEE